MTAKKKSAKKPAAASVKAAGTAKKTAKAKAAAKPKKESKAKATPKQAKKKRTEQPTTGQSGPPLDLSKEKLNTKEIRVVEVLASDLNPVPINSLATNCFPDEAVSKANSWVRNSLRRLVRSKWVEKVGKGTYRLDSESRSKLESASAAAPA